MTSKKTDHLRIGFNIIDAVYCGGWSLVKASLRAFPKFLSVASLASVKLPVLPLLVYTDWNKHVENSVDKFVTEYKLTEVQVRSEAPGRSTGGMAFYHWPVKRICEASHRLFKQGAAIVGIQPPGNIYRNDYSVHMDFDWPSREINLEVVGPGFTATHLSKGGLVHERVRLHSLGGKVNRVYMISDEDYRRHVKTLLDQYDASQLSANHSLLLSHLNSYSPIPFERLVYLFRNLDRTKEAVLQMDFKSQRAIVAMSWIQAESSYIPDPVFWDIHESPVGTKSVFPTTSLPKSGIKRLIAEYRLKRR